MFLDFCSELLNHKRYNVLFMFVVYINMVILILEADYFVSHIEISGTPITNTYRVFDLLFIAFYTMDLFFKCLVMPWNYWNDGYHILDIIVVFLYYFEWISSCIVINYLLPGMAIFRIIRGLRAIRQLQVVVDALLNTMKTNVVDVLILLFLVIFVFGVVGHYTFGGNPNNSSYEDWGSLGNSLYTLWVFVCADGWTPYQDKMSTDGYVGSEVFTALFIFLGNFIITNLFIGGMIIIPISNIKVICQNIEEATRAEKERILEIQRTAKMAKRDIFLRKQQRDISQLLSQKGRSDQTFQALMKEMVGTLRHEDIVPMNYLACNPEWLEAFMISMRYHEYSMFRMQHAQYSIASALCEYVDRRLSSRKKV